MANAKKQDYTFHKLSAIFPRMGSKQREPFVEDINKHGLRDPICLYEGEILDGRERYEACKAVAYTFDERDFFTLSSEDDPIDYLISHNLHKRHLTESQRGMVAARLATLKLGANQHNKQGTSIEGASKLLSVSTATTERAKAVIEKGVPGLVQLVDDNKLKASVAQKVANLPQEKQQELVTQAVAKIALAVRREDNPSDVYDALHGKLIAQLNKLKTAEAEAAATKTISQLQSYVTALKKPKAA
jgi:hypothetical protein